MDLKHIEIKEGVKKAQKKIRHWEKVLEEWKEECDHPDIKEENYMWRIGSIRKARVCQVCGKALSTPFSEGSQTWTIQTNELDS